MKQKLAWNWLLFDQKWKILYSINVHDCRKIGNKKFCEHNRRRQEMCMPEALLPVTKQYEPEPSHAKHKSINSENENEFLEWENMWGDCSFVTAFGNAIFDTTTAWHRNNKANIFINIAVDADETCRLEKKIETSCYAAVFHVFRNRKK